MADQSITTSFMAPLWWVQAFELALQLRRLDSDPFSMSTAAGLSPALTEAELTALLVLMQQAQQQILQGQKWLTFSSIDLQKNHSGPGRTRKFLYLRVLQILRSLQIFPAANQDPLEPVFLFDREERRRDSQGIWRTGYRPAPLATELILGFGEPYAELSRLLDGKPRAHRLLGRSQPLPIRPSVWQDLTHIEQYVFIQIQKASCWENCSFRWDSVFGRAFESLFNGLNLPLPKNIPEGWSPFRQKMKLLSRVGRKLVDQGVFSQPKDLDYLAIEQDSDPLIVLWQMNEDELSHIISKQYEQKCARYFRESTLDGIIKKISPILASSSGQPLEGLAQLWRDIDEADRASSVGYLSLEGNLLLNLAPLFFEWSARRQSTDVLRLPGWLAESAAVQEIFVPKRNVHDRLHAFAKIIKDQPEYAKDIETLPKASMAAPITWRQRDVLEFLASHSAKTHLSREVGESEEVSRSPSHRAVGIKGQSTPVASTIRKTMPDGDLRRQANEELAKLREKDPKRYSSLKQLYLDNLEQEKKQIIAEMMDRMQPNAFDDHLKYSLVKFMLENPRSWQSGG